jgi:hypothetical protein
MAEGSMPFTVDPSKIASNRQEAIALGLKLYHGRVCATHGTTIRRLSSGDCPACMSERSKRYVTEHKEHLAQKKKEWAERNADKMKAYFKEYHEANREKHLKRSKDWYEANKERSLELASQWAAAHPEKRKAIARQWFENNREQAAANAARWQKANPERTCQKTKRWQRANPGQVNAGSSIRRARKRQVVPVWLSAGHRAEIAAFFTRAKREGVTVDHIVPIAGCRCCGAQGLHVPWNMQLLTPAENASKNNRCQDCYDLDRTDDIPQAA